MSDDPFDLDDEDDDDPQEDHPRTELEDRYAAEKLEIIDASSEYEFVVIDEEAPSGAVSGVELIREHLGLPPAPPAPETAPEGAAQAPEPEPLPPDLAPEPVRDPQAPLRRPVKILNTQEILNRPPIRWLVDGVFVEHGISMLYGPPGGGKSFFGLDLALCVATGIPWHGHFTKRKIAITVAYEGVEGMKQRLESWKLRNPTVDTSWFGVIEEPLNILDAEDLTRLIETLRAINQPIGLVTLDTYARSVAGRGDENSAQDAGRYIAACDMIVRELDCHIQIVHHSNADGSRERGSTALRGAVDTSILLNPSTEDQGHFMVSCVKQKDAPPFKPMRLKLVSQGNSCVVKRDTSTYRPPPKNPKNPFGGKF